MSTHARTIMTYREAPDRAVFRIVKERGFPSPREGVFVKIGNSHARAFSGTKEIIPSLDDVVKIIPLKAGGKK